MPLNMRELFPFTHKQAVESLVHAEWSSNELDYMLECSNVELHGSLGVAMRELWGLNEPTWPLAKHYRVEYGLGHGDDMAHLIVNNFLADIRDEGFSLEHEISWLKKHWLDQGVNPLTLERIG